MHSSRIPYGRYDLEPLVKRRPNGSVKCLVRGCQQWLKSPTRVDRTGDECPEHGIIIHGNTYKYADPVRNIIVEQNYFRDHILNHRFKFDRSRFGHEVSEDAVTFNVLMSFRQAGLLHRIVQLATGLLIPTEPRLYLWGLHINSGVEPWELLQLARDRFESDLPVKRPLTEPDIALWLPETYLILIEAKFTSSNSTFSRDTKTKLFDLTIDQVVNIYSDDGLRMLDEVTAGKRKVLHHQLWRNAVLGEWMATQDSAATKAYLVNLVREGHEDETCEEFVTLINPDYQDRFEQITWEQVYAIAEDHRDNLGDLCRYLEYKTAYLKQAFSIKPRGLSRYDLPPEGIP